MDHVMEIVATTARVHGMADTIQLRTMVMANLNPMPAKQSEVILRIADAFKGYVVMYRPQTRKPRTIEIFEHDRA